MLSAALVNKLTSKEQINWNDWINREILSYCDLYIEAKFCKVYKVRYDQILAYQQAVHNVKEKRIDILDAIIDNTKYLKKYMIIHSVFDIKANTTGDWFVQYLIDKLQPTQEQVDYVHKKNDIPANIMEMFNKFNPRPISNFEETYDNALISYKLHGKRLEGEQSEPIFRIDKVWNSMERQIPIDMVEKYISSFEEIECQI